MKSMVYCRSWSLPNEYSDGSVGIDITISEDYLDCLIAFCAKRLQNMSLGIVDKEKLEQVKAITKDLEELYEAKGYFNEYNTAKGVQEFLDEVKEG